MEQYIPKSALIAEIDSLIDKGKHHDNYQSAFRDGNNSALYALKERINALEVKDPYEQCIQYASIESGIKAHAEDYSFNIESELFNQLTKEQQVLWRKEIEQACISGGYSGLGLAKDPRYKENLEVKEVDLEKEIKNTCYGYRINESHEQELGKRDIENIAHYFYELGLKAQKEE